MVELDLRRDTRKTIDKTISKLIFNRMSQATQLQNKPVPQEVLNHFAGMRSRLSKIQKKQPHEISFEEVIKQVQSFQKSQTKS